MNKYIAVITAKYRRFAELAIIENTLTEFQRIVGGKIEVLHTFNDNAVVICNRDGGKLNRAIYDENSNLIDIAKGDFIVCGTKDDEFISLSENQLAKYNKQFFLPEQFIKTPDGIQTVPYVSSVLSIIDKLKEQGKDITQDEKPQEPKRDVPPEL